MKGRGYSQDKVDKPLIFISLSNINLEYYLYCFKSIIIH